MYSAAFIFEPGDYADEFDHLNTLIDEAARTTSGFIGVDTWYSEEDKRVNVTYYWDSMDAIKAFSEHPMYREAREQQTMADGFRIIISEEIKSYGNHAIGELTLPARS